MWERFVFVLLLQDNTTFGSNKENVWVPPFEGREGGERFVFVLLLRDNTTFFLPFFYFSALAICIRLTFTAVHAVDVNTQGGLFCNAFV